MGWQRRTEKKNKIKTLGTEWCANIESLYTNKKYVTEDEIGIEQVKWVSSNEQFVEQIGITEKKINSHERDFHCYGNWTSISTKIIGVNLMVSESWVWFRTIKQTFHSHWVDLRKNWKKCMWKLEVLKEVKGEMNMTMIVTKPLTVFIHFFVYIKYSCNAWTVLWRWKTTMLEKTLSLFHKAAGNTRIIFKEKIWQTMYVEGTEAD